MKTSQLKLSDLAEKIAQLEVTQSWMQQLLETQGIKGPWLSPAKAAAIIGVSRDRLMDEIEAAERLRAQGKKGDLIYGIHYRNIANIHDPDVDSSTWQIHFVKFADIMTIPPDQRKVG
jgi:hypothetical protein